MTLEELNQIDFISKQSDKFKEQMLQHLKSGVVWPFTDVQPVEFDQVAPDGSFLFVIVKEVIEPGFFYYENCFGHLKQFADIKSNRLLNIRGKKIYSNGCTIPEMWWGIGRYGSDNIPDEAFLELTEEA